MNHTLIALALLALLPGDDWPTSGGDAARSNSTPAELAKDLSLRWSWRSPHPSVPAWPSSDRQPFDRAFHPIVVDGVVAFGSSADGKVTALDAATGRERWSLFTDGPIRFAPAAWKDRLFVASDDGHLYCVRTSSGELACKNLSHELFCTSIRFGIGATTGMRPKSLRTRFRPVRDLAIPVPRPKSS